MQTRWNINIKSNMGEPFLDTNIILRFLTGDHPEQQQRAKLFFERLERNELQVTAPVTVIADTVYVLSSPKFYNLPRVEIAALLKPLLRLPAFQIRQRGVVLLALDLYGSHAIDFGDALIIASMKHAHSKTVYSFDQDFDGFEEIVRQEP